MKKILVSPLFQILETGQLPVRILKWKYFCLKFNYRSAFSNPILLNLNEMKCPRSLLYNDTKFTSIFVQIRTKSNQYEEDQNKQEGHDGPELLT